MQAILFDKDGTLLDFEALWLPVARQAIALLGSAYPRLSGENRENAMEAMGVRNGSVDVTGCLCGGTYGDIARALLPYVGQALSPAEEESFPQAVEEAFSRAMSAGETRLIHPELPAVLADLKAAGKRLFVVTADTLPIAEVCLKKLGIDGYFDEILAAGGVHPGKPDPYYINYIHTAYCIPKEEMCMVGDTPTDMLFARNGGIKGLALGSCDGNRQLLAPLAAATAKNPVELYRRHEF